MIRVAGEVQAALRDGRGVVALETTLVAHGFPPGEGVEVGLASEGAVRESGSVPATVGVLDGEIVVGLTEQELERFDASARKVGPRDAAAAAVQRVAGATTVGGTLAVCNVTGIRFMGTGGLGGVHRGWPSSPDVSADLGALAQTRALVVSSGVKSLLDVAATSELLETLGVPVLGWRTDELPLFYAAHGGPPVSARVESAEEAAQDRSRALGAARRRPPACAPTEREPGRRGAADRASTRRSRIGGHSRPGGDAVRPRVAPPRERRSHAASKPRARDRQRAPRGRGRRRDWGRVSQRARFEARLRAPTVVILSLVALAVAACGGSKTSSGSFAAASAGQFLETRGGTTATSIASVRAKTRSPGLLWRVEFETDAGHRCVEMTSRRHPASVQAFKLVRITSGGTCQTPIDDVETP